MNEKMNGGISTMRGIFCRLPFQKGGITAETIAAQGFDSGIFYVDTRHKRSKQTEALAPYFFARKAGCGAYLRREHRRALLSLLRQPDGRAQCQLSLLTLPAARPTFLLHKKAPAESLLSFPCGCMIIRRGFPRFFYAAFLSFGRRIFRMMATKAAGTMPEPPKIS